MPISPFLQKHWRVILVCSVIAVLIIVTVVVVLVVVIQPGSPASNFKGPANINGDTLGGQNVYNTPQIIINPTPNLTAFGSQFFVHAAGYICSVAVSPTTGMQSLLFYYTDSRGAIQGPQQIDLNFIPVTTRVCNGAFAPIFNVINEVYYFFLTIGTASATNPNILWAHNVVLFSLDTSVTSTKWQISNIQSPFTKTLSQPGSPSVLALGLPNNSFTPMVGYDYIGTFGDNIQVIYDDTFSASLPKQSLYISGSQYDLGQPGGSLYWFYLADNSTSPQVVFKNQIQDAKLLLLHTLPPSQLSPGCVSPYSQFDLTKIPESTFINSFGSSFFVTSGLGNQNILLVGNVTGEDYCSIVGSEQPAAPNGYVQGFTFDTTAGTWVQSINSNNSFNYRYFNPQDASLKGFGFSCAWFNQFVIVGFSGSPLLPDKNAIFNVYPWLRNPIQSGALVAPVSTIAPTAPFLQTDVYPISAPADINLRYNTNIFNSADNTDVILSIWNKNAGNVITVQNPFVSGNTPYQAYSTIQTIGGNYSSAPSPTAQTRTGFAQGTYNWISRTGLTARLAFNDPNFNNGSGRFIVLTKSLE